MVPLTTSHPPTHPTTQPPTHRPSQQRLPVAQWRHFLSDSRGSQARQYMHPGTSSCVISRRGLFKGSSCTPHPQRGHIGYPPKPGAYPHKRSRVAPEKSPCPVLSSPAPRDPEERDREALMWRGGTEGIFKKVNSLAGRRTASIRKSDGGIETKIDLQRIRRKLPNMTSFQPAV